jgi:hypothetical protein
VMRAHGIVISARAGIPENFYTKCLLPEMISFAPSYPIVFLDEADIMLGSLTKDASIKVRKRGR